jgi:hypothetical protein
MSHGYTLMLNNFPMLKVMRWVGLEESPSQIMLGGDRLYRLRIILP